MMISPEQPKGVDIIAGGHATRLRRLIIDKGHPPNYPKHLLPTGGPSNETLLGRTVRQALEAPTDGEVTIHANSENEPFFATNPDVIGSAKVKVGNYDNFFGPLILNLLVHHKRTLGCTGDSYIDFTWERVLGAHDSQRYPITFVIGKTIPVDNGLVFGVKDSGQVESFTRVPRTAESDLVNIGMYVFDPTERVLSILSQMLLSKRDEKGLSPEVIAAQLVDAGLVGAYVITDSTPFNVNTPETYKALLEHTAHTD